MTYWDDSIIEKVRKGYYSAVYFNKTKEVLIKNKNLNSVTIQIFQKNDDVSLCGISHVIELLKAGTGYFNGSEWIPKWDALTVHALSDGDTIQQGESVMHINGPYAYFAQLESLYLGILARETRIATNAKHIVKAAKGKQVLFFADRFDYFLNQEADGYAAHVGGVANICTQAQGMWFGDKPVGTIPHALIAVTNGDTIKATKLYQKQYPNTPLVALVDFDNDCLSTSLLAAKTFGKKLWGIRLDTAEDMIDKSLQNHKENENRLYGVNPTLVKKIRHLLNKEGFGHVKIIVSGGFSEEKISLFEQVQTPVDIYAVGSAMLEGKVDFTADIVRVGIKKIAKAGREIKPNSKFKLIS